jgi:predicted RNase H-like HicB family nuclease
MNTSSALQYRVLVTKDEETGSVVAEIPALHLADYGADVPEALDRLLAMLTFHLDCLQEEGKPFPVEQGKEEGFYLRVNLPAHAA